MTGNLQEPGSRRGVGQRRLAIGLGVGGLVAVLIATALILPAVLTSDRQPATAATGSGVGNSAGGNSAASSSAAGSASGIPGWAPTTPHPTPATASATPAGLSAVTVDVPAIDVHTDLIPLGVGATGELVPPESFDIAGWFTGGPVPGEVGPAIIAGHVDSRAGPGIFFRLEEMKIGDVITVTRSDGSIATFTVFRVAQYPKTAFPTAEVYGPTPDRELRLITCGGDFDRSRRSYLDDIVIYAVRN